jgi:hypothetical protein
VEVRATLAERALRESATSLASAPREADEVVQKVTLLEGDLVDAHWACDLAEVKLQGLFDRAADADQRWEDAER